MSAIKGNKLHAVLLPYPSQGHIIPFMELAKLLHSRDYHITFVNTEFNHRRLIRSKGPDFVEGSQHFRFETIPDGLDASDSDATQDMIALCHSMQTKCLSPFLELLKKLNNSPDVPPVTCIVSTHAMGFAIDAAEVLGVPAVQFWTASACGFMAYLHYSELVKRGIVPFKDDNFANDGTLDTLIDWIPGMPNIRLKDIPSFIRTTDPNDFMFKLLQEESEKCLKASAIIINTFDSLEHQVLDALRAMYPRIYTMGPLSMLVVHVPETELNSLRTSLWKEDTDCLTWLDKKEPNSVLYVNYGSTTVMSDRHFKEFAWGLANSMQPFLWIVRPDIVKGNFPILPDDFFEEIKGRGLIVSWCAQDKVLSHPSIGAFLTHAGWNSTLESVCGGVPVICWPFFAEQPTNCRYACNVWKIGMEVDHDVKREKLKLIVEEMMKGEKGKEMRKNAQEWKMKAQVDTNVGGSSYNDFDRLIREII